MQPKVATCVASISLLVLELAACGIAAAKLSAPASSTCGSASASLTLHVWRDNGLDRTSMPAFDRWICDSATVQQLYDAAYARPHPIAGAIYHCSINIGLVYHLVFLQAGAPVQRMDLEADGCEWLHILPNDTRFGGNASPLGVLLAQALGLEIPHPLTTR